MWNTENSALFDTAVNSLGSALKEESDIVKHASDGKSPEVWILVVNYNAGLFF